MKEFIAGMQVFSEAGRAINYYANYLIVAPYAKMDGWLILAPTTMSVLENNVCTWYYISKDGSEFDEALKVELKKKALIKVAKKIGKLRKSIIAKLKKTNYATLTVQELANLADEYYDIYGKLVELPACCRMVDRGIRRAINNSLLSVLSVTKDFSFLAKENIALLKLAQNVKENKITKGKISGELKKIHKKYCYVTRGYFNEPARTIEEYERMLLEMANGNPKETLAKIKEKFKQGLFERKKLIKTLSLRERKIAEVASEVTLLKDYSKESYNEVINNSDKLFEEIAKRTGKTTFFIRQLAPNETLSLLKGEKDFGGEVLERARASIIVSNQFSIKVLVGEEVELFKNRFLAQKPESVLKGRIASKGYAKGSACIVLTNEDFKKMKKGEILVVQNTNPGYVPLMHLASGIIAEDGGITAHVSVTSRELGIPCIVGIENATKIFKDKEIVEVDANNGVVRKFDLPDVQKSKPIYFKAFTRSVPLAMVEVWYFGEKADPRQYTLSPQVSHPYIIFEISNGGAKIYFGRDGIEWVKKFIITERKKDSEYYKKVAARFKEEITKIQNVLFEGKALSIKEYSKFIAQIQHTWPWFELLWWYIDLLDEMGEKDGVEMETLQDARRFGELYYPNSVEVTKNTLEKAYPRLKKLVNFLTLNEALTGKLPSKEILEDRSKFYCYTDSRLFLGKTKEQIAEMYSIQIEPEETNLSEIKGMVAYPGKVIGRVRKVISKDQINHFKEGEILVAPSTLPEFLPAMKKAAALVSDEGGMISHASIVARELKKPCIVGTKNAFGILKDGDLVEVDANHAVVTVIEKAVKN
jgi:phosphoenolpyruvate synthase/pyruvate phosphate dikinase